MLVSGRHAGIYEPRTAHEWARIANVALEELGDDRRYVPLKVIDWEEPLFLLATPAQAKMVTRVKLADDHADRDLPKKVELSSWLGELAASLARKLPASVRTKACAAGIELDLAADAIDDLVALLYRAHYDSIILGSRLAVERS